jgi:hypothetical protein
VVVSPILTALVATSVSCEFSSDRERDERGWEQNDDVSTLMPSVVRYGSDSGVADEQLLSIEEYTDIHSCLVVCTAGILYACPLLAIPRFDKEGFETSVLRGPQTKCGKMVRATRIE